MIDVDIFSAITGVLHGASNKRGGTPTMADDFGDVTTVQRMSNEICFLASTCLSWWFADRSRK